MSSRNSYWDIVWQILQSNAFWFVMNVLCFRHECRRWLNALRLPTRTVIVPTLPEPLPPGTASAIATAMQPLPQFVNNSQWMQLEAYQRQHDVAAHFAMQSTMPRFSPAMLIANQ